jgi:hypothetical protein
LQLTNVGFAGVQQGIYDLVLDPNFSLNHYYYIFYTLGTPNRDRVSRFTANALLTGTVASSELVLYQDPDDANAEHHGGEDIELAAAGGDVEDADQRCHGAGQQRDVVVGAEPVRDEVCADGQADVPQERPEDGRDAGGLVRRTVTT